LNAVLAMFTHFWLFVLALEQFRKQQVDFLVATDVAARVRIRSRRIELYLFFYHFEYSITIS
jgi:hypothetical protein